MKKSRKTKRNTRNNKRKNTRKRTKKTQKGGKFCKCIKENEIIMKLNNERSNAKN